MGCGPSKVKGEVPQCQRTLSKGSLKIKDVTNKPRKTPSQKAGKGMDGIDEAKQTPSELQLKQQIATFTNDKPPGSPTGVGAKRGSTSSFSMFFAKLDSKVECSNIEEPSTVTSPLHQHAAQADNNNHRFNNNNVHVTIKEVDTPSASTKVSPIPFTDAVSPIPFTDATSPSGTPLPDNNDALSPVRERHSTTASPVQ